MHRLLVRSLPVSLGTIALVLAASTAQAKSTDIPMTAAEAKADKTLAQMTPAEKTVMTHGIMSLPLGPTMPTLPEGAIWGAGFIPGLSHLGVPALIETDASLGVAYVMGMRHDGATGLPSGLSMASSWNPEAVRQGGAMIGSEARAKGFNVLLAGGANLMRDPRAGRTFEYFSEDPLLTGDLAGAAITGIQSNHIISTIKHFALNGQETGRKFVNSEITDAAARESDLLAFQIGIEKGHPLSVMCSYNKVNGFNACDNDYLLNTVLKKDWGYKGFVMSDWGAVPSLETAIHGLDQQSGEQLDKQVWLGEPLAEAAAKDPKWAARLDDMNRRILTSIYAAGLDTHPVKPSSAIDFDADAKISGDIARQGIVLLRNESGALPLVASAQRIAVIGGYANAGVLTGGGSSQVHGKDGPVISLVSGDSTGFDALIAPSWQPSSPLKAMKALAPNATFTYRSGDVIADAVAQARKADVAIVFAVKPSSEGFDQADLTLPYGQDALIAAVTAANPHTIVVLETGNPVAMPWLDKTAAVMEAWFPGARGGEAIADVLFGKVNPSGHLPITFPRNVDQLPRPVLDGYFDLAPNFGGDAPTPDAKLDANYNIEGSDVGYRWFARKGETPLFPFGFGLSYTTFASSGLKTDGKTASFTLANTGKVEGATVGQLYMVSQAGTAHQRLVGFQRVDLAPGASQKVSVTIDPRLLAEWQDGGWSIPAGDYAFALGADAQHLGQPVTVHLSARHWKD